MSDIRTLYDPNTGAFDWRLTDGALAMDDGLDTSVALSLYSDRQAEPDDVLPDGSSDPRGWWGDAYPEIPRDRFGSRLWLLSREKDTPATLAQAREYALEALRWLIDDNVARAIDVVADNDRPGILALRMVITGPDRQQTSYRFASLWEGV